MSIEKLFNCFLDWPRMRAGPRRWQRKLKQGWFSSWTFNLWTNTQEQQKAAEILKEKLKLITKYGIRGKSEKWYGSVPPGCLLGDSVTRFSAPLGARLWHYATELRTLSVTYPLCSSALMYTDTMDNPSEMCPLKCLPVFVQSIIHNLTRAAYSPNGFHKSSWFV